MIYYRVLVYYNDTIATNKKIEYLSEHTHIIDDVLRYYENVIDVSLLKLSKEPKNYGFESGSGYFWKNVKE